MQNGSLDKHTPGWAYNGNPDGTAGGGGGTGGGRDETGPNDPGGSDNDNDSGNGTEGANIPQGDTTCLVAGDSAKGGDPGDWRIMETRTEGLLGRVLAHTYVHLVRPDGMEYYKTHFLPDGIVGTGRVLATHTRITNKWDKWSLPPGEKIIYETGISAAVAREVGNRWVATANSKRTTIVVVWDCTEYAQRTITRALLANHSYLEAAWYNKATITKAMVPFALPAVIYGEGAMLGLWR